MSEFVYFTGGLEGNILEVENAPQLFTGLQRCMTAMHNKITEGYVAESCNIVVGYSKANNESYLRVEMSGIKK